MKKIALLITLLLLIPMAVWSDPFIMEGDYVRTAVSDDGTLGYGYSTSPGILHDATGTSTFATDDYLTPGTPWELFAVSSDETGNLVNNNSGSDSISGAITSTSSTSYDNYVRWEGGYSGYFDFTLDTYFNDGDERISFTTQITALANLSNLTFLRSLDPDPDVNTYDSYDTVNGRGYDANSDGDYDDAGDIAPEDWVHAEGTETGLTIGLYTESDYTHNTGVSSGWSTLASFYLAGNEDLPSSGYSDYTIGLAFDFGNLAVGDSVLFDYSYIMGDSLETADIPGTGGDPVPEPSTILLLGSGLAGLAFYRRKKNG